MPRLDFQLLRIEATAVHGRETVFPDYSVVSGPFSYLHWSNSDGTLGNT